MKIHQGKGFKAKISKSFEPHGEPEGYYEQGCSQKIFFGKGGQECTSNKEKFCERAKILTP